VKPLFVEQSLIVASSANRLTRRRKVELAELANQPWCGPSFDNFPWSLVADEFKKRGLAIPSRLIRVRSILARASILSAGRFLTVMPWSVLQFGKHTLALKRVPVDLPKLSYPVGLITLKGRLTNPIAHTFCACVQEVLKSAPKRLP
jgi:DNA-binding transcriptional LysR family regulator